MVVHAVTLQETIGRIYIVQLQGRNSTAVNVGLRKQMTRNGSGAYSNSDVAVTSIMPYTTTGVGIPRKIIITKYNIDQDITLLNTGPAEEDKHKKIGI